MPTLAVLISSFLAISFGSVPDEQRLLDGLLKNYNPGSRPVFNASHVVIVKFGITLIQIHDMVSCLFIFIFQFCV